MPSGPLHPLRRRHAAWWTLVIGLAVTGALGWELRREAMELDRQRLARRVVEIQSQLDARLEKSEMLLHNLRDYLTWSGESSEKGFHRWCYENGHTINCRWLAGIALATNRNLAKWPENVPKTPRTWGTHEWESIKATAVAHRVECDLAMTSPLTNTMRFAADYGLRGTLERSDDRKRFPNAISAPRLGMSDYQVVMLDGEGNGVAGTCMLVPLYRPEVNALVAELMHTRHTNWSHRAILYWLHFTSVIVAPVDFNFLAWTISEEAPDDVAIELFASTNQVAETWLNKTGPLPRAADPEFRPYLSHRQRWPMYGNRFSIYFYTTPLFEAQSPRRMARVSIGAGIVLTLLATALVGVASRARNAQEQMTEQIREARDALAAAQMERSKVSRDLHDGTIQTLYAIQLGLGHAVRKIEADPARAGRELLSVRAELDTVIAEIRQFITADLGADGPVDFGAVLQTMVQRARAGTTATVELHCEPGAAGRLSSAQAVQLANIAREALSNSLRHANPQNVQVSLRAEAEEMILEISDDGAGFDPNSPKRTGVGLASMMSRAREARGTLEIRSSPASGTRVVVRVPVSPAESPELAATDDSSEETWNPKA